MSEDLIIKHCSPTLAGLKTANLFTCVYAQKQDVERYTQEFNRRFSHKGVKMQPLGYGKKRALIYAEVSVFTASDFSADMVADFDAIAFGCPAMGDEVLEEDEFQPMFDAVLPSLNGKKVALFGSYGWGDGQWMRDWQESCQNAGVSLACECVIANDAPDDEAVSACKNLGAALV